MSLNDELLIATTVGDYDKVRNLVRKGADVNISDNHKQSPLHHASYSGNLDIAEYLIDKGADVKAKDKDGNTPLHNAVRSDHYNLAIIEYLLEKDADPNAKDNNGNTPLHLAARHSTLEVVKYLVGQGADIMAKGSVDHTPLHFAVLNSNLEVVQYLLEKDADPNVAQNSGLTPLHLAADHPANLEIVRNLIKRGASVSAKDNKGRTPLDIAKTECSNCKDIISLLEEKNANRDASTTESISSTAPSHRTQAGRVRRDVLHATYELFDAILLGNYSKVKSAIKKGANVNAKDSGGFTPLYQATDFSSLEIVKYLIEKGADVNAKDSDGDTILHKAVSSPSSDLEIVKCLVKKGAGVNNKGYGGHTPLHSAALCAALSFSNNLDIVKYLIEKDADINAKDDKGRTPLDLVLNQGIIDYLKAKGASSNIQNTTESVDSTTPFSPTQAGRIRNHVQYVLTTESTNSATTPQGSTLILADNVGYEREALQLAYVPQDNMTAPQVDFNNTASLNSTLLLLDMFARKVTGQKPVSTTAIPGLSQEQRMSYYTLNINNDFEKAVKYAAKKSGVPVKLSRVRFLVYDEICTKIASGKSYEIPAVLNSYARKACTVEECDEFMKAFNEKLNIEARPNSRLKDVSIFGDNVTRSI